MIVHRALKMASLGTFLIQIRTAQNQKQGRHVLSKATMIVSTTNRYGIMSINAARVLYNFPKTRLPVEVISAVVLREKRNVRARNRRLPVNPIYIFNKRRRYRKAHAGRQSPSMSRQRVQTGKFQSFLL